MFSQHQITIGNLAIGNGAPLVLIAGPCVIEDESHTLTLASSIQQVAQRVGIPFIFKASFDKANRSSIHSFRGPGLDTGLTVLAKVKRELSLPVTSDIHDASQADAAGEVLDIIQIPAFLCRQTDLLVAAAATGKVINAKKGQFMSPEEMANVAEKLRESHAGGVLLTERGTFFGYNRLVNDMTSIPRMQPFAPVVYDATHSCQQPGGGGSFTAGAREFLPTLAPAAIAAGADALFMEVHNNPAQAKSDATTVWPLDQLEPLLQRLKALSDMLRKDYPTVFKR